MSSVADALALRPQALVPASTARSRSSKAWQGRFIACLTGGSALLTVASVLWIVGSIVVGGHSSITWKFLTEAPSQGMTEGGIFPAIVGTFFLVVLMSLAGYEEPAVVRQDETGRNAPKPA